VNNNNPALFRVLREIIEEYRQHLNHLNFAHITLQYSIKEKLSNGPDSNLSTINKDILAINNLSLKDIETANKELRVTYTFDLNSV